MQPVQGWYPDPTGRHSLRWWDGASWTDHASARSGEVVADPVASHPVASHTSAAPSVPDTPTTSGQKATVRPGAASRALVARARSLRATIDTALEIPDLRRRSARRAFEAVRDDVVGQQMAAMPLVRLKETTGGRLRLGAIEAAGYHSVGLAAAAGRRRLEQLPGVGPQTAAQVIAARQLEAAMTETVRVRLDPDRRPALNGELLGALRAYETAQQAIFPLKTEGGELAGALDQILAEADGATSRMKLLFSGRARRVGALDAIAALDTLMRSPQTAACEARLTKALANVGRPPPGLSELWQDYERRAVVYNGFLIEVGELVPDFEAERGFVPAEIAARVHEHPLDTSLLNVSLRGYQAFGAKFALVQRKTMLGDEMGLGKTIEALAAMCHLHSEGESHFMVVCPASVLVNWAHETQRHSKLRPHRLHGADRARNLQSWVRHGGVAITTYDSLRSLSRPDGVDLALLIVDEAHYVKNPDAARSKAVRQWVNATSRVVFLSGTPMENKVEEFRTLVNYLQPGIAARVTSLDGLAGAASFRHAVAPVYLRRNQSDVLDELPPRIETEEWVQFEGPDLGAYREAVTSGNFMAMRRAAYAPGTVAGSAKLGRLTEIVAEAASNNRKVVVFSFFRDVLDTVTAALSDLAVGPITGSVAPAIRQELVDEFTARPGPAALVSQIEAGGVGLNIQAASVVILTEPQWKPTIEDQAIARCHRMGQIRPVDVHRLLAEDSVDQRMLEILATKGRLFDQYVRRSELKESSPDAIDVSDIPTTQQVAGQADAERRIIEIERKRMGVDAARG